MHSEIPVIAMLVMALGVEAAAIAGQAVHSPIFTAFHRIENR
jgi:hypothetical protein